MIKVKIIIDVDSSTKVAQYLIGMGYKFSVAPEAKGERRFSAFSLESDLPNILSIIHQIGWERIPLSIDRIKIETDAVTHSDKDS